MPIMGVDALSGTDFQRNYLWEVILPDVGSDTGGLQGFELGRLAQEVFFGNYSMPNINTMRVGPYQANFAGLLTVPNVRITFLQPSPDFLTDYITSWKSLIVDSSGLFQPKSNYQKNIYVRFLDTDGGVLGQYKLIGCFPMTYPSYNLDYGSNKITNYFVEFAVDKIEYSDPSTDQSGIGFSISLNVGQLIKKIRG